MTQGSQQGCRGCLGCGEYAPFQGWQEHLEGDIRDARDVGNVLPARTAISTWNGMRRLPRMGQKHFKG